MFLYDSILIIENMHFHVLLLVLGCGEKDFLIIYFGGFSTQLVLLCFFTAEGT